MKEKVILKMKSKLEGMQKQKQKKTRRNAKMNIHNR